MNTEIVTEEHTVDTRLIPLRAHDQALAKLRPVLEYDLTTDAKAVDRGRKDAKAGRCAIENARKELVAESVAWQKKVNTVAKTISDKFEAIETHCERLEAEHKRIAAAKAAEEAARKQAALEAVRREQVGNLFLSDAAVTRGRHLLAQLPTASEEHWATIVSELAALDATIEQERQAAEAARIERERLAAEQAELRRQQEELRKQQEEAARQQREEAARLQREREEVTRLQREEAARLQRERDAIEAERRTAAEAEARRIAAEEAARKIAETNAANAKNEQERHAANGRVNQMLIDFIAKIQEIRPTRKDHGFGPQLEAIIERGVHDMAAYFHDHMRDHYDARIDA